MYMPKKSVLKVHHSSQKLLVYHLDIPWSTPTQKSVSQEISPPPPNALQAIFPTKYVPHDSISGNLPLGYDTYKNLSIFHESVSIMTTLDKPTQII